MKELEEELSSTSERRPYWKIAILKLLPTDKKLTISKSYIIPYFDERAISDREKN
jgi:hypothetical protein